MSALQDLVVEVDLPISGQMKREGGEACAAAEYEAILTGRAEHERWAKKLLLHPDDLRVFLDAGQTYEQVPPANSLYRKSMLAYLKKRQGPLPKWVLISGIWPEGHSAETGKERRAQLRALYKATVLFIRHALALRSEDKDAESRVERSVFWDPVYEVCRNLEICQSKLSSLLREFCGHSLTQVIDCVRVERVKKVMRVELKSFVRAMKLEKDAQRAGLETKNEVLDKWGVWAALRASRKWPEFSQNIWANELGFASYRRLYRACVAVFGKTPHQLEMAIIEGFLNEADLRVEKVDVPDFLEMNLEEIERMLREVPQYAGGIGK